MTLEQTKSTVYTYTKIRRKNGNVLEANNIDFIKV